MAGAERSRIRGEALAAVAAASDPADLARVEREFLGKEGAIGKLLGSIRAVPPGERRAFGEAANELKRELEAALAERRAALEAERIAVERAAEHFDPTLPAPRPVRGSLHPVTRVVRRLEQIFTSMGYAILDGPEVELDYYNFEALNIPADHPAREMHDTFWCDRDQKLLMRTHTSPVQIRALERMPPPFRAIVPGRCFRNETTDASHEHTFHQMEGLVVGEGITVGHLIGTMRTFLREVFERDLEVRLRPGYFPFVEPGFELDVRCPFCEAGCSVCKRSTWIELCPCGMVHPRVLAAGKVDPERYTGFAFGLGLSRLVMLRYGIDDIRHLMGADLRFLEQF
ncbi:MAG TPA: phenylalanine--tRNA ligase subunit alpha [Planctomycetota bacterium]